MPGPGSELIGQEEIKEVLEVLESGWLFRYGSHEDPHFKGKVGRLESELADVVGTRHALAVNSGSSALLVALLGNGIGPGDEVIVPGYTFVASMSSVAFARAVPVLAEIDETLNLDPRDVLRRITPRTKAIMAVHMLGNVAEMDELSEIAKSHGLLLVEDAAQAFGASYRGRAAGSIGDVGIYSFNFYKTITAGDGGMIVTNDEDAYRRYFALHDQGHSPLREGVEVGVRPFMGLDFRMTELTAAVLLAQLRKLQMIQMRLHEKKALFKSLINNISGVSFRTITDPEGELATFLTVFLPTERVARQIATELGTKVVADSGWHVYSNMEHLLDRRMASDRGCPFHCPSYPSEYRYSKGMLPRTDAILGRAINIGIGIVDPGIGAGFGTSISDGDDTIRAKAKKFSEVASRHLS